MGAIRREDSVQIIERVSRRGPDRHLRREFFNATREGDTAPRRPEHRPAAS